jgi:RNA polymerase sigma-70 factor (ECF subfamily)
MNRPLPSTDPEEAPAAALYRQHGPLLFAWLLKQTRSWEDAEDLLLEVFLASLERQRVLAVPEGKRRAWLLRVAQHKLMDYYRHAGRRQHVPLETVTDLAEDDETLAPDALALRHEQYADLHAALQELPAVQRDVVQLRFSEGLRGAEIARVLGKREGAVYTLLRRALTFLRERFGEDLEGNDRDA